MLGGINIYVSSEATTKGKRLIKKSRYRSKRVWKKLLRRHGGEFERVPAIFQTPAGIVCHPVFYQQLKEQLGEK